MQRWCYLVWGENMTDEQLKAIRRNQLAKKEKEVEKKPLYFTTGHTLLDLVVGAGEHAGYGMGYPQGVIARDHGDSSSSKSYKATELIAANYHKYKRFGATDPYIYIEKTPNENKMYDC